MQSACKPREHVAEVRDAAPKAPVANEAFGHVAHASADDMVIGEDSLGIERVRFKLSTAGEFRGLAPPEVISWHVQSAYGRNASAVRLPPGTGVKLELESIRGVPVWFSVSDAVTQKDLAARVVVQGIDGTLDPSFGSEFSTGGAGPLADATRRPGARLPLPPGHYRVTATRGPEWGLATREFIVTPQGWEFFPFHGEKALSIELQISREVLAPPTLIACDLHVHSNGSFDSRVGSDARAVSLEASGIAFAVPTEHNTPGHYPVGENDILRWFPGVELTPDKPSFGHVGAFPWPTGVAMPQTQGITSDALYTETRKLAPKALLVLHHPRFENDAIGMFRTTPSELTQFRYDGLELMNGYDNPTPEHALALLGDLQTIALQGKHTFITAGSDAHNLLYSWAGWPRTYVQSASSSERDVLTGLRAGRVTLSNGPVVLFDVDGKGSGSTVRGSGKAVLRAHVMAASWVNVSHVAFYAGGVEIYRARVAARADGVTDTTITWPTTLPREGFVTAVATGDRNLSEKMPFLNVMPLGIAGPVWIGQ